MNFLVKKELLIMQIETTAIWTWYHVTIRGVSYSVISSYDSNSDSTTWDFTSINDVELQNRIIAEIEKQS